MNRIGNQIVTAEVKQQINMEERKEYEAQDVPSFLTSVLSRPSFKHLEVNSNKDLSPGSKEPSGVPRHVKDKATYNFVHDEYKTENEDDKSNDKDSVGNGFSKTEWNTYLGQDWINAEQNGTPTMSASVSSRSGSEWTESGDPQSMDFYESINSNMFNPGAKVLQKYREDQDQFLFMCSVIPMNNEQELQEDDYLLPPKSPNDNRKTLVLDLDETLVHCFLDQGEDTSYDWTFQVDSETGLFDVFCRVRPHLEEFLKECANMFELVLFTASQDNYANKVLDHVDPAGYIQHRLFRRHCTNVGGNFVKDLSILGRSLSQTIIIDNSPLTFAFQPSNGIPCDNWFDDQMDQELSQLLPILQHLKSADDVRDELSKIFKVGCFLDGLRYSLAGVEESDWMCVESF